MEPVMPSARTMTARRVVRLGAVVAVCALVAGCGGGGMRKQELSQADQARAERINFTGADFPAGWSKAAAVGTAGEGGSDEVDRTIEECLAQEQDASAVTAGASSEGFVLGARHVSSNVTFAPSVASARSNWRG
jgi:hypothetical protein